MSAAPPDRALIEDAAIELGVDPAFVEKDWHAVQMLALLSTLSEDGMQLVFSGGTSLSKGFEMIKRFSKASGRQD